LIGRRAAAGVLSLALGAGSAAAAGKTHAAAQTAPVAPATPEGLSKRIVSYRIDARLDPGKKTVTGNEVVTYRNDSPESLTEIPFHLYPNAFASDQTLYARELLAEEGPHPEIANARRKKGWGWMKIQSVALDGGGDLAAETTLDETVMRVRLPAALAPGQSVSLRITWETKLPNVIARMGWWGDHYQVMQWFPKPGVYRDGAWNVHPFHAHSEFFADFGTFEVNLTVPDGFVLEATGLRTGDGKNPDGSHTYTYRANDVHDFAWVASRSARIAKTTYQGVEIVVVYPQDHEKMVPRIQEIVRACLRHYAEWYMPYPYPRIVVISQPMGLGGGMEYPMLFTTALAWFLPDNYIAPESVTAHEFGHQYWYGIMASNEFEEPWLDEGINTFSTIRLMETEVNKPSPGPTLTAMAKFAFLRALERGIPLDLGVRELNLIDLIGFDRTPFAAGRPSLLGYPVSAFNLNVPGLSNGYTLARKDGYVRSGLEDPLETPAWNFYPGNYNPTVYSKTAMVLETLKRILGPGGIERILKEYVARNRFTHPKEDDFLKTVTETAGVDISSLRASLFDGTAQVDFAVGPVQSEKVLRAEGFILPTRVGQDVVESKGGDAPGGPFRTEVIVRRLGDAVLPVDVLFTFEDGSNVRERWDAAARWHRYTYERPARLRSVVIDPDRIYALDLNFNNNSYTLRRQRAAVNKITAIWLFWLQSYLQLVSSLA